MVIKLQNHKCRFLSKRAFLGFTIAGILAFSFIPQLYFTLIANPNNGVKIGKNGFLTTAARSGPIAIYYNPYNSQMEKVAFASYELIHSSFDAIQLIPIYSLEELGNNLKKNPEIAIYAFDAAIAGPKIGSPQLSWALFYNIINDYPNTEHVVGLPNTYSLQKVIEQERALDSLDSQEISTIHLSDVEQTDTALLVLYNVWSVGQIYQQKALLQAELQDTANALTATALKVYTDNFNYFLQVQNEPVDLVGEFDSVAAEEQKTEMWARNAATLTPASYTLNEDGSLEEVVTTETSEDFTPKLIAMSPSTAGSGSGGNDFIIGDLPFLSGLQGPIGEIVDGLLWIMNSTGYSVLGIPSDVMVEVQTAFQILEPLLGIVTSSDSESALKTLLNVLANEFPFKEEYKPYLDIFIKALFNFRGTLPDIQSMLWEIIDQIIESVLPESVGTFINDILGADASLGTLLQAATTGGKNTFDTLASYFMNNVVYSFLNKTLNATLGIDINQASNLLTRAKALFNTLLDYTVSFDLHTFASELMDGDLVQTVLGTLDNDTQATVNKTASIIKFGLGIVDLVDNFNATAAADMMLSVFTKVAGDNLGENLTKAIAELVKKMVGLINNYTIQTSWDVKAFMNEVWIAIHEKLQDKVIAPVQETMRDITTFFAGIRNPRCNLSQVPDMLNVTKQIVNISDCSAAEKVTLINFIDNATAPLLAIVAVITNSSGLKQLMHNSLTTFFPEYSYLLDLSNANRTKVIASMLKKAINYFDLENILDGVTGFNDSIETFGEVAGGIFQLVNDVRGKSFTGILQSVWVAVSSVVAIHPSFDEVPIDTFLELLQNLFPSAFGLSRAELPDPETVITELMDIATPYLQGIIGDETLQTFLDFAFGIKDLFTQGMDWMVGKILDWVTGLVTPILDDLETEIEGIFGGDYELFGFHNTIPISLGEWSLLNLKIDLALRANFNIELNPLLDLVKSLILDNRQALKLNSLSDFFNVFFNLFEISPRFYASLGVNGLDTSKNSFMQFLLKSLGVNLAFTGSASFYLNLFTFRGGAFQWEHYFEIIEWAFNIKMQMSKTFTLLDFLTGGVGGGVLNTLADYLGLDSVTVTIALGLELDIVKRAATADKAEESQITLIITLGATIHAGISLLVVSVSIDGSLEIILTFFMDLAAGDPMKITLRLVLTLKVKLSFWFDDISKTWTWEPGGPWDLSPKEGDAEYEQSGMGFDEDQDGLSDDYEAKFPGLKPNSADSDGDGLTDKFEIQSIGTDPSIADCDGDGLLDGEEWELGTNPMRPDTDWDGLTDYDEVHIYLTDPFEQDTDGDGLTDEYEIFTPIDNSNVTVTVSQVTIGGQIYTDRTDPLNPDTDGDGLVDGDEGPMGIYYGLNALYNESISDDNPVIFNYGYTHPLDADTDDDSYLQFYNGEIDTQVSDNFLYDLNDGVEVGGITIILNEYGQPVSKRVYPNPVNPDTDGDTGVTDRTPQPGMWLLGDGYEIAQGTDPLNGDTDGDGLLDGIEGVLTPYSNHTNPADPDTDDDGLYDMQEFLLGTSPRRADTDGDMIPDGDEFYLFHTNANLADTDLDGVGDGEEVYTWHSNPLLDDSDGDGILDGREIYVYGSDPMDEDSDDDGLLDYEEIFIYFTDPFLYDSDGDILSDGEEINTYHTDPFDWDTDDDSLLALNGEGEITWSMGDYDEVMIYGTDPLNPDTDSDGLSDSIELYIRSGIIPWLRPILLDATNNDTDGDGFVDGIELMLKNVTHIFYPFYATTIVLPYSTFPDMADTDGDNITDYLEVVIYSSNANSSDSDNDTLTDWQEIEVYHTSAIYADTDGDGLLDTEELGISPQGASSREMEILATKTPQITPTQGSSYGTDPSNPDSDGDGLPDGAEVILYDSDPMDTDSDNDGIDDSLEYDTDLDGIADALEFQLGLQVIAGGGILNPDSDFDGLTDGDEYYVYHTLANRSDTDGDSYADGTEIIVGTDPLVFTTQQEFEAAVLVARGTSIIRILLPLTDDTNYQNTVVRVVNLTIFQEMWFRYRKDQSLDWSSTYNLEYDAKTQQWTNSEITWEVGTYFMQVYGRDSLGTVLMVEIQFTSGEGQEPNVWLWIGVSIAIGFAAGLLTTFVIVKKKKNLVKTNLNKIGRNSKPQDKQSAKESISSTPMAETKTTTPTTKPVETPKSPTQASKPSNALSSTTTPTKPTQMVSSKTIAQAKPTTVPSKPAETLKSPKPASKPTSTPSSTTTPTKSTLTPDSALKPGQESTVNKEVTISSEEIQQDSTTTKSTTKSESKSEKKPASQASKPAKRPSSRVSKPTKKPTSQPNGGNDK